MWASITFWYVIGNIVLMFVYTIITAVGGGVDLAYLVRELRARAADPLDDGRAVTVDAGEDEATVGDRQ